MKRNSKVGVASKNWSNHEMPGIMLPIHYGYTYWKGKNIRRMMNKNMAGNGYKIGDIQKERGGVYRVTVTIPSADGDTSIEVTAPDEQSLLSAIPYAVTTNGFERDLVRLNDSSVQRRFAWRAISSMGRDRIRGLGASFSIHETRKRNRP